MTDRLDEQKLYTPEMTERERERDYMSRKERGRITNIEDCIDATNLSNTQKRAKKD